MNKSSKFHRIIASFFLTIFFPTLMPNNLYASNNGPNSIEAAKFEPVDAVDMVNLATGDMNYVLPLLNIPSPEGGYPINMSYKAGIAMDQESSWTGLGWSLNPGAINRNVNGYADDILGETEKSFAYDVGGQNVYNSIGVGANLYGMNFGVGAYWGSNNTFGGSVSYGVGPANLNVGTGTNGFQGGIGYSGSTEMVSHNFSNDVTFSSLKSQGTSQNNGSTGISKSTMSINNGDYAITTKNSGVNLSYAFFNLNFGHTTVNYNLFNEEFDVHTGMLYHNYLLSPGTTPVRYATRSFDTKKIVQFKIDSDNPLDYFNNEQNNKFNNFVLPNLDSYSVSAQGIGGSIKPSFNEELNIRSKTSFHDNIFYQNYLETSVDGGMKLNNKLFFEFEGENSSFLRIDRTNILRDLSQESAWSTFEQEYRFMMAAKTNNSNVYNENLTTDNIQLKNGYRKRTGKFVEVFTNEQIGLNLINGINFIEAKGLNRNNSQVYKPQSIGGFRITDLDGKTYHYSLPVINFESWYKNFKDPNAEDSQFIEKTNDQPYATDWLLTAITGPDYVDTNFNNQVDENDYGYWVEFEYGKWTDGYIWNGSSGGYDVIKGSPDRYEYYKGRKQLYYLDAIKTRTHTAYFVKSLKKDGVSSNLDIYNSKYTDPNQSFDFANNPKTYSGSNIEYNQMYGDAAGDQPKLNLEMYNIPNSNNDITRIFGIRRFHKYASVPKNYSLKLDRIVLVNNKKNININKANGTLLLPNEKGYIYENRSFQVTNIYARDSNYNMYQTYDRNGVYYKHTHELKNFDIHLSQNVLDVNDIDDIEALIDVSDKTINFGQDYSLVPNSKNSTAINKAKLTLNEIEVLGKSGASYIPKQKFLYNTPSTIYDSNLEDGWGYHKTMPESWSLKEIINPLGGKIKINYESDNFNSVSSKGYRYFNSGQSFYITKNTSTNELFFEVTKDPENGGNAIVDFNSFFDYYNLNEKLTLNMFICRRSKYGGHRREVKFDLNNVTAQVVNVTANSVTFKMNDSSNYWSYDDQNQGWILNRKFSYGSVRFGDGSNDGVIMRLHGDRECHEWRDSYDNDDVVFQYRMSSSNLPKTGTGGGLRVKDISVYSENNLIKKTKYIYNKFDNATLSSGVTSFVPRKYPVIIPYISILPSPMVIYGNVSVEEYGSTNDILQKTQFTFETLDNYIFDNDYLYKLGNHFSIKKIQNEKPLPNLTLTKNEIKNNYSNIGRLKTVKLFNSQNQLISVVENKFKSNLDNHGETGVKEESFISRYVKNGPPITRFVNAVSMITYPSKLESKTVRTNNATQIETYDKYDFLTGQVLETTKTLSGGKTYKSKTIPAYNKYVAMGNKVDDVNNANMLSQTAVEYSYILDGGTWKETGVGITTWNNIWTYQDVGGNSQTPTATATKEKIWRKHKTYTWNGVVDVNGIFTNYDTTSGKDDGFDWTIGVGSQPNQWKQTSEVTLYDHYSGVQEVKDINGNKAATKTDVFNEKVETSGNAAYNEMYYASAENIKADYWLAPEVRMQDANRDPIYAHTGKYSVATTNNSQFGVFMRNGHKPGKYKISVWVHKNNYQKARLHWYNNDPANTFNFNGEKYFAGDWVLLTHYTDVHYMNNSNAYWYVNSEDNSTVYYDDLMIRPIVSSITGYVYNEWDELISIVGNNGLATKFEYDAAGRLVKTYVEVIDNPNAGLTGGFKLKSENKINYKNL